MSKQINTHLFFHMNDPGSKHKDSSGTSSTTTRKPKKASSNLFSGYEIDTNPPLPSETGDYYDYYTNYGIPDYYGPTTPPTSPPYMYNADYQYNYYDYRGGNEYDYYGNSATSQQGETVPYNDNYDSPNSNHYERNYPHQQPNSYGSHQQNSHPHGNPLMAGSSSSHMMPSSSYSRHPQTNAYLQPPLISPPIQDPKRASPTSPFPNDIWSYRNESQGLSAFAHKLHRITFVEACIFQPPDLPSPVRLPGAAPASAPPPPHPAAPQAPVRPVMPVLAQGERSPTSTGGTQYYQEWTSKHMKHLCSRFEKPAQQQLLMNVERKSKYPFIILCTPDTDSLSKSSSSSSTKARAYQREISQQSAFSLEEDDDEEDEESHWITQKQRDSINSHYLPPPPPPLLMPHIWPEIRYIDGLYTVCASIVRPGSGVPSDFDDQFFPSQTMNSSEFDHYGAKLHDNHHYSQHDKHISFHDSNQSSSNGEPRPAGYIVSAFATFPGEDSERLEKNWLLWTGARILYKYLPMCVGLRRLIFLKRCPDMYREDMSTQNKIKPTIFTGFTYVLLCECYNLKEAYIASVCTTIDQLRARCCGYSALYLTHYQQQQQAQQNVSMSRMDPHGKQQQQQQSQHASTSASSGHHHQLHHHHHHHQNPPHQHHPGHHHQQSAPHHHIPRHHRSTDFSEFDTE